MCDDKRELLRLNIENMINKSKKDYAYTMVDVDKADIVEVVEKLKAIPAVLKVNVYYI